MPSINLRFEAVAVASALILALGAGAWYGSREGRAVPAVAGELGLTATTVGELIVVDVSGAVARPGLVAIPTEGRVADAVSAAGGATGEADLASINLAAPLRDGEQILVPAKGEASAPRGAGESTDQVDVNRATASELEALPGVGPVLAKRIVAFRELNGPFTTVEDLLDVGGIGEAKLDAMRDAIRVP